MRILSEGILRVETLYSHSYVSKSVQSENDPFVKSLPSGHLRLKTIPA